VRSRRDALHNLRVANAGIDYALEIAALSTAESAAFP